MTKRIEVADRGYLLDQGTVRLEGTFEELLGNDEVSKRYPGG